MVYSEFMEIKLYSERGLVNSILLDILHLEEDEKKTAVKKLLSAIRFCGGQNPFQEREPSKVNFYVEPSFAQFGDPDLIIYPEYGSEKYVIFVEAKRGKYEETCTKIKPGDTYYPKDTINSYLNIQLTLKYRFMKALLASPLDNTICEKDHDSIIYQDLIRDDQPYLRKLADKNVIKNYTSDLRVKEDHYYFVALTDDDKNTLPFVGVDPQILPPLQNWDGIKDHFGLLTYDSLEHAGVTGKNYDKTKNILLVLREQRKRQEEALKKATNKHDH